MTQGLLELGEVLLASSQRRLDAVSRNVSNATTPGYKSELNFEDALGASAAQAPSSNLEPGALRVTGARFDLAIAGPGFFHVRAGEHAFYTRAGAFLRDGDGRLVDGAGAVLQSADGSDLIIAADAEIAGDGTILERGLPVARVGIFALNPDDPLERVNGAYFRSAHASLLDHPEVRQGMLEGANVDMASEMLDMMGALRSAEIGARVVQTYDTLIGQTISTFSRGQR